MKLMPAEFSVSWVMPSIYENYARFFPSFAWISETVDGKAKQLYKWTSCRETFTANLKKDIVEKCNNICTDRTRFALKSTYAKSAKEFNDKSIFRSSDKAMITAMKMLNIIEEKAGWDLTTITKLERRTIKNVVGVNTKVTIVNTYFIDGPKEWMKSTPFISLYTLIIRSCWFRKFSKIKQSEEIAPMCKKIIGKKYGVWNIQKYLKFIEESYEYWMILVLNQKELLGNRKSITIYNNNGRYSGIARLISLSPDIDSTTIKHWKKIVKKHKEKASKGI